MAPEISDRDSAAAALGWVRELAARQQNADVWAGDHRDDHHAGVPAGTSHEHEEGPADAC